MIMGFAEQVKFMSQSNRQPLIDMVKVVAAQFIFFHHAAIYGPLSEAWHAASPVWAGWLADYGLLAVQVFLVVAGYLAAQTLSRRSELHPLLFISRRFERLARPLWFVLILTIGLSAFARPWLVGDMLPTEPVLGQFLAHVFLLQGALGYESLSAGVWYTAIDFQLYVIMVWLVLVSRKTQLALLWPALVTVITVVSAVWINLHTEWDASGFYFFGAYGLGALVYWANSMAWGRAVYLLTTLCVVVGLWLNWRLRLGVAVISALSIWFWADWRGTGALGSALFARLNASTYLFFLLNFPILIVANLLWLWLDQFVNLQPFLYVGATWAIAVVVSDLLQRRFKWLTGLSN
jgi:peptidoglycan/LPS O-acetylase OafA/YrhL